MLFVDGHDAQGPSLMGAIHGGRVASAIPFLLVTFAREQKLAGQTAARRYRCRHTRIRPVLMRRLR